MLPNDSIKLVKGYEQKCSYCGKYHKVNYEYEQYFSTYDGYDSYVDVECLKCKVDNKIYRVIKRVKKALAIAKQFVKEYRFFKGYAKITLKDKIKKSYKMAVLFAEYEK